MRSERIGSLIGAVGGLAFVLINTKPLPEPWSWLLGGLGVGVFLAVLALVVVRPARPGAGDAPLSRRQLRTYGFSVTAMVVAIVVGARLLNLSGLGELTTLWVVLAVGAHFVPFARIFHAFFAVLGWVLVALAVLGAALVLLLDQPALVDWFAVLAGFVLLAFALLPALAARNARARG